MMEQEVRICPICRTEYRGYPAISRRDNHTEICQLCGMIEAMEDYVRYRKLKQEQRDT